MYASNQRSARESKGTALSQEGIFSFVNPATVPIGMLATGGAQSSPAVMGAIKFLMPRALITELCNGSGRHRIGARTKPTLVVRDGKRRRLRSSRRGLRIASSASGALFGI